ncbi:hypothetical protein EV360DRAFT_73682 [Lentinula raphanica]|nr:hypothetical protein EV360DRAFT_73682 [Lentinula raphanica]
MFIDSSRITNTQISEMNAGVYDISCSSNVHHGPQISKKNAAPARALNTATTTAVFPPWNEAAPLKLPLVFVVDAPALDVPDVPVDAEVADADPEVDVLYRRKRCESFELNENTQNPRKKAQKTHTEALTPAVDALSVNVVLTEADTPVVGAWAMENEPEYMWRVFGWLTVRTYSAGTIGHSMLSGLPDVGLTLFARAREFRKEGWFSSSVKVLYKNDFILVEDVRIAIFRGPGDIGYKARSDVGWSVESETESCRKSGEEDAGYEDTRDIRGREWDDEGKEREGKFSEARLNLAVWINRVIAVMPMLKALVLLQTQTILEDSHCSMCLECPTMRRLMKQQDVPAVVQRPAIVLNAQRKLVLSSSCESLA